MNILLNAYEFWRYERKNKFDFENLDEDGNLKDTLLSSNKKLTHSELRKAAQQS